jgi:hypothetical protein
VFSQSNCLSFKRSFAGRNGTRYELAPHLIRLSPLLGILQNDAASLIIDNSPFFDLIQRSKAAEASKVIV